LHVSEPARSIILGSRKLRRTTVVMGCRELVTERLTLLACACWTQLAQTFCKYCGDSGKV